MGQFHEVQFAKQLEGTDNYGNITYSVKFTDQEESVLWRVQPQTVVEQGTKVFGRIEEKVGKSGKPYRMFKREQQEAAVQGFTNSQPNPSRNTTGSGNTSGGRNDDRADGMRQGMCINNAANYVNALGISDISDKEWAKMVYDYAKALYVLGDLNVEPKDTVVDLSGEELDAATTKEQMLKDLEDIGF